MRGRISELSAALQAVCPIISVAMPKVDDKTTWRLECHPEATREEREDALGIMAAFIYDPTVKSARELKREAILNDPTVPQSVKDYLAG